MNAKPGRRTMVWQVALWVIMTVGYAWAADINSGNITVKTNATISGKLRQGLNTSGSGNVSVVEGWGSVANGDASHAEGAFTESSGWGSHTEGYCTKATNYFGHAEGNYAYAYGYSAHAEGGFTIAAGPFSHAGGLYAKVMSAHSNAFIHATGTGTNNYKQTLFPNAAHFDRLITLSPANDSGKSVLNRDENDLRYSTTGTVGWLQSQVIQLNNGFSNYWGQSSNGDVVYSHADRMDNPHHVSAGQVGALVNGQSNVILNGGMVAITDQFDAYVRTNHMGNVALSGIFGIGITEPCAGRFHVAGGYGGTHGQVEFQGSTNSTQFFVGPQEDIYLRPGKLGGYVIIEKGRLGIGTTNPTVKLDVYGIAKATLFQGSGASLTELNGTNFVAGSVGTAQLNNGAVTLSKLDSTILNTFAPINLQSYAGNNLTYSNNQFHAAPSYADGHATDDLKLTGGIMSGLLDMGTNRIAHVADAVDEGDAVNKRMLNQAVSNSFEHVPAMGDLSMGWYTSQP